MPLWHESKIAVSLTPAGRGRTIASYLALAGSFPGTSYTHCRQLALDAISLHSVSTMTPAVS